MSPLGLAWSWKRLVLFGLPLVSWGQLTTLTPTNSVSLSYVPVGVAAMGEQVVVAANGANNNYTTSLSPVPTGYANTNNVVDLGRRADGVSNIELNSGGEVKLYPGIDITSQTQVNLRSLAGSSSEWGVSNSFLVGGIEYAYVGYTAASTYAVGLVNLTANSFSSLFTFTPPHTPTGMGNYTLLGGSSLDDQRVLVSFSNNTVLEFGTSGTQTGNYFWFNLGGSLQDITYSNGKLFGVTDDLTLASVNFTPAAIPEPSTYAFLAGLASWVAVIAVRRQQRRGYGVCLLHVNISRRSGEGING